VALVGGEGHGGDCLRQLWRGCGQRGMAALLRRGYGGRIHAHGGRLDPTNSEWIRKRRCGYDERQWLPMDGLDGPIDGLGGPSRVFPFLFLLTEVGIKPSQKMLH